MVVPLSLTGIIFQWILNNQYGLLNSVLREMLHLDTWAHNWLGEGKWAMFSIVIVSLWKNMGMLVIFFMAGLAGIPSDIIESAKIDGANAFQRFFKITLPSLSNVMFFCFITLTADSWKIFNEPFMLQGPGTSNVSLFQYMYESGFNVFKLGYASSIGCMLTLILLIVSVIQFIIRMKQGEV